tara:strand:- start:10 stop:339 length:330 start_codon:yes stop_codon:yes gene_type:complete
MAVNNGLTVSKLNSKLAPGRYHDGRGTGLNVLVKKSGAKFWVQRYTVRGKRHDLGLGSYPSVSLADARQKALQKGNNFRFAPDWSCHGLVPVSFEQTLRGFNSPSQQSG